MILQRSPLTSERETWASSMNRAIAVFLQRSPLTSERETSGATVRPAEVAAPSTEPSHIGEGDVRRDCATGGSCCAFNGALSHRRGRRRPGWRRPSSSHAFNGALSHRRGRPHLVVPGAVTVLRPSTEPSHIGEGDLIVVRGVVLLDVPSTEPSHIGEGDNPSRRRFAPRWPLQRSPLTSERETSRHNGRPPQAPRPSTEPSHIGEGDSSRDYQLICRRFAPLCEGSGHRDVGGQLGACPLA